MSSTHSLSDALGAHDEVLLAEDGVERKQALGLTPQQPDDASTDRDAGSEAVRHLERSTERERWWNRDPSSSNHTHTRTHRHRLLLRENFNERLVNDGPMFNKKL